MISSDIQKLEPGTLVEMFEIDNASMGGSDLIRMYAGVNELGTDLVWNGNTYYRTPIQASGFEWSGKGTLPRPRLTIANLLGAVTALNKASEDMVGFKVTRKRTFAKYLDAVNFTGGTNATADPSVAFADDVYYIDRKATENKLQVEYELAAAFDIAGKNLPGRQVIQNVCPFKYRIWDTLTSAFDYTGTESCGYTGTNYSDISDTLTGVTAANDVCAKRLASCKIRFGAFSQLSFGGFPGAGQR